MKKLMLLLTAVVLSASVTFAQETKPCCKKGETCTKEMMAMCEKHGCKDGKCTDECKKACKEAGMKDCKKGKCCKEKEVKA